MAQPGIVLIKRMSAYHGAAEEWSNVYHFSQAAPSTHAAWKTIVDALAAKEATLWQVNGSKIVRAYCYADTDNDAVDTVDYTALGAEISGTLSGATGTRTPGDTAVWVRWKTAKINSKGKAVYLRKYFHDVVVTVADPNVIDPAQKTALLNFGTALAGGTGAISGFTLCGHDGTAAGVATPASYATTRTLKRRGKRPPS